MTNPAIEAIVIGASAGALEALSVVLPALPSHYPRAVLVVVHVPPDRKSVLVDLFQAKCNVKVQEAEDKEPIKAGTIYFAPPDYHLLVEKDKSLSLSSDEPVLFSRPSIDVLFESAADAYGSALIGVVLTGANQDGSHGIRTLTELGGMAIVQRPDEAFSSAMPEAALAACPGARVLSLEQIAAYLQEV
jgi:two-component system chemotaxis response regulator CheB